MLMVTKIRIYHHSVWHSVIRRISIIKMIETSLREEYSQIIIAVVITINNLIKKRPITILKVVVKHSLPKKTKINLMQGIGKKARIYQMMLLWNFNKSNSLMNCLTIIYPHNNNHLKIKMEQLQMARRAMWRHWL